MQSGTIGALDEASPEERGSIISQYHGGSMASLRRLTRRELFILVILIVVLSALGTFIYLESDVTPSWVASQERISLAADGQGIFVWRVEGGLWADVTNRNAAFDVTPTPTARIVSLNGKPVGAPSGIETTDRSGRIVVVVKAEAEGPITVKGRDLKTGKSISTVRLSVAD
jgi:hypothetical protein